MKSRQTRPKNFKANLNQDKEEMMPWLSMYVLLSLLFRFANKNLEDEKQKNKKVTTTKNKKQKINTIYQTSIKLAAVLKCSCRKTYVLRFFQDASCSRQCRNGQQCYYDHDNRRYACLCEPPFDGKYCEQVKGTIL